MALDPAARLVLKETRELAFAAYLLGLSRPMPTDLSADMSPIARAPLIAKLRVEFYREWETIMDEAVQG